MRLRAIAWLMAAVPSLAVAADADLWWHVLAGREILESGVLPATDTWSSTAYGAPWINHEWIPDIALASAFDLAGNPGLLVLRALFLVLLVAAWFEVLLERVRLPAVAVLLMALPWPLLALLANLRPQTVTWALVPVALWLGGRALSGSRWAIWALPGLTLVWANLHGGFLFGWGLAGLALLLGFLGVGSLPWARRWECLGAAVAVALCPVLHPFGLAYPLYVLREVGADHPGLPEWNPPEGAMWGVWALAVGAPVALHLLDRRRPEVFVGVAFLVAAIAALFAAKFVALVLILGAVVSAAPTAGLIQRAAADPRDALVPLLGSSRVFLLSVMVACALHLPFLPGGPGRVTVNPSVYPMGAIAWIRAEGPPAGALAVPLGWGGPTLYHLRPGWKVTMDGRNTTVYPVAWVHEHTRAFDDGVVAVLEELRPDLALVRTGSKIDIAFRGRQWVPRYSDSTATVLGPPGSPAGDSAPIETASVFPGGRQAPPR